MNILNKAGGFRVKRTILLIFCLLYTCMPFSKGMAESTQNIPATIDGGNADRVHLRAEPSIQATSLGLYFTGTELLCESTPTQEWTKVVIGSQEGYIKSEYLRWGDDREGVQSKQPLATIKAQGWVNMRNAPSEKAQIVQKLYKEELVSILGETSKHWYLVASRHGFGYVWSDYISLQDQPVQYNPLGAIDEIFFEFEQLTFHYGDSFSDIMRKSNHVGYQFECPRSDKIYYYSTYDEPKSLEYCIGIGFDDNQCIDYVSLQGSGAINKNIKYPITFDKLTCQIGESILPQVFITKGKVDTVCYLWECGSYFIQAMAWPLSANNTNNLNVETIEVYSGKRAPTQQITPNTTSK